MLIKKETEYAVLGLILLDQKNNNDFYDIKVFAKEHNLSETLLPKVFQKLAVADIVESRLGPGGGFRLHKDPKEITLWAIFEAVQMPNVLKCYMGKTSYCLKPVCPLRSTVLKVEQFLEKFLENTTLFSLSNDYKNNKERI